MPTLTQSCAVVFGILAVLYVFGIAGIAGVLHVFGIAGIAMHPVKGGGALLEPRVAVFLQIMTSF